MEDHGGEVARPTTVDSTELLMAGGGAVHGGEGEGEAHFHAGGTFDTTQLDEAAVRRDDVSSDFDGHLGAADARFGNSGVYHNYAEFARHARAASGRSGELLAAVFHGEPGPGVVQANVGEFMVQPGPDDEVIVGHHFSRHLGTGRGEVRHVLPDGVGAVYDNYGYCVLHPRPGVGRAAVPVNLQLPDAAAGAVVYDGSVEFAQRTLPGTERSDGIAGALRGLNLAAGYHGSGPLADNAEDLGTAYDNNPGTLAEHPSRLLVFVGVGACSVAANEIAAGPGSPAVAFGLFALLLGGLFLVMQHVLRA